MGMNENYTPEKWTKKRYEQCVKELCEVINTQNQQLQEYKDKEDRLREYIENEYYQETEDGDKIYFGDFLLTKGLLEILNEGDK